MLVVFEQFIYLFIYFLCLAVFEQLLLFFIYLLSHA